MSYCVVLYNLRSAKGSPQVRSNGRAPSGARGRAVRALLRARGRAVRAPFEGARTCSTRAAEARGRVERAPRRRTLLPTPGEGMSSNCMFRKEKGGKRVSAKESATAQKEENRNPAGVGSAFPFSNPRFAQACQERASSHLQRAHMRNG